MSIIDRARDALNNATPGPWGHYRPDYGKPNPVFGATPGDEVATVKRREDHALIAAAPELAAEVVRLHDQFAALADEWGKTTYFSGAAARIREVIEGEA